jgi:hypothetical protein
MGERSTDPRLSLALRIAKDAGRDAVARAVAWGPGGERRR